MRLTQKIVEIVKGPERALFLALVEHTLLVMFSGRSNPPGILFSGDWFKSSVFERFEGGNVDAVAGR